MIASLAIETMAREGKPESSPRDIAPAYIEALRNTAKRISEVLNKLPEKETVI